MKNVWLYIFKSSILYPLYFKNIGFFNASNLETNLDQGDRSMMGQQR